MTTKRLLRNIVLCLIPVLLYFSLFLAFEPNNYFGLKAEAVSDDVMARLREYEKTPQGHVIIGDSLMAKFSTDAVQQITSHAWANLAYGGASLAESLDLLSWLLEQDSTPETVVLGLSYYNLNLAYSHDRQILKAKDNPFRYLTNLTYNINMWEQATISLYNLFHPENPMERGADNQTQNPADYVYIDVPDPVTGETLALRMDLVGYVENSLRQRTDHWSLDEAVVGKLLQLAKACKEKGVLLIAVCPPVDDSVHRLVIDPNPAIEAGTRETLAALAATGTTVLDYEFAMNPNFDDSLFFDGHHLDTQRGLPIFTEILFTTIEELESHGS